MKTKTVKTSCIAVLAHLMCFTLLLSHLHAKDAASLANSHNAYSKLSTGDITAKAIGDLHHHIDKMSLKHTANASPSTQARTRQLEPGYEDMEQQTFGQEVADFLLRLRIVTTMFYQYARAG